MFDITFVADSVNAWTNQVGELPKPLADALAVADQSQWVQSTFTYPDIDKLTVKNLEGAVNAYAAELAAKEAFNQAHREIKVSLAQKVVRLAGEYAPTLRDSNVERFNTIVGRYVEALKALPDDCSPSSLVANGGGAVEAFNEAVQLEAELNGFHNWLQSLTNFPKYAASGNALTIVAPKDRAAYQDFVNAKPYIEGVPSGFKYALAALNPDRYEMKLMLPDEGAALVERLNNEPAVSRFPGVARLVTENGVTSIRKSDGVTSVSA